MPAASTPWLVPDWPGLPAGVGVLQTTRLGGVSTAPYDDGAGQGGLNLGTHVGDDPQQVARNRALLRAALPAEPAWLNQVHGTQVVDVATLALHTDADAAAGLAPQADASISSVPGKVCIIMTADCLPVLFCDAAGTTVGAAHAGWRGLADGVLEQTLAAMRARGAAAITAWMGPAIGAQRFEVGAEVRAIFLQQAHADGDAAVAATDAAFQPIPGKTDKYLADLYALARWRLQRAGVLAVYGGTECTATDRARFYSYRRDGVTGRLGSLIWIK